MNQDLDWLRTAFPKKRPTLPPSYQNIYELEYVRNRGKDNELPDFKQRLENWMHTQVANVQTNKGPILEIGAGTLNHVRWEETALSYDIVEPFELLYRDQPLRKNLRTIYSGIEEIPLTERYGKILSVAVLEHVEDLPQLVARSALLLEDDGVAAHGIPSEGGLLWYMAWRFGTGLSFRVRTGLSYAPLMHHEHINNSAEILKVLSIFFGEITYSRFPLPFLHGSFYSFISLRKPNRSKAEQFLMGSA